MTESYGTFSYAYKYRESFISAISAGFFLLLVGVLFITTSGLFEEIIDFFRNFALVRVPNTVISLPAPTNPLTPAPTNPLTYVIVYTAAQQFCFALGVFQIVILALRFAARSQVSKKAETVGNLVYWIGAGYLTRTLLLEPTRWAALTTWFIFWAATIMLIGVTLIIRAIILAAAIPKRLM